MENVDIEEFIISKKDFKKYFNNKSIIAKDKLQKYYMEKNVNNFNAIFNATPR